MIVAFTGFVAGCAHVLSGADHLAAIAPLAADGRQRSWITGLRWGLGHALGVAVIGALALTTRAVLPIDRLSTVAERIVGIALIAIGSWGLWKAFATRVHVHAHEHDGLSHVHVHAHAHRHEPTTVAAPHAHGHAAFAVGALHGLAGSSHLLGVLPSLALPTTEAAVLYLAGFGCANLFAMAGYASVIGALATRLATKGPRALRALLVTSAALAIAVGGAWLTIGGLE